MLQGALQPDASQRGPSEASTERIALEVPTGALLNATTAAELSEILESSPRVPLKKPRLWPGPECDPTTASLAWDSEFFYACFECRGAFLPPRRSAALARWEEKEGVHPAQRTLLCDDRVQLFVMPPGQSAAYVGIEVNAGGRALTYQVDVAEFASSGAMDWSWGGAGDDVCCTRCFSASDEKSVSVLIGLRWAAIGCDAAPGSGTRLRVQTNRNHVGGEFLELSEHAKRAGVGAGGDDGSREEAAAWGSMSYSASTDAGDAEVNFHRPAMFADAVLQSRAP